MPSRGLLKAFKKPFEKLTEGLLNAFGKPFEKGTKGLLKGFTKPSKGLRKVMAFERP